MISGRQRRMWSSRSSIVPRKMRIDVCAGRRSKIEVRVVLQKW